MVLKGLVLAFALVLAGCAGIRIPGLPELGPVDPEQQQVLELIGYAQRVAAMSAEQQRRAYALDNQAFAKDNSAFSRVRLALLLATPGTSVRDDSRAAGLLEPLAAQDERASPMRLFARLMYAQLAERQRAHKQVEQMEAERQRMHKQVEQTEAERQRAHKQVEQMEAERQRAQKQVEQMRQQMEAERQREQKQVEQMREQIEALKTIERAITERVQQGQPRRQ